MNYIKRLQAQVAELEHDKETARQAATDLLAYITSTKFTSMDAGDRRFLVNTQDVMDRLSPVIVAVLP